MRPHSISEVCIYIQIYIYIPIRERSPLAVFRKHNNSLQSATISFVFRVRCLRADLVSVYLTPALTMTSKSCCSTVSSIVCHVCYPASYTTETGCFAAAVDVA